MKRLILLRHGEADWAGNGVEDFERALTIGGRRRSAAAGLWLTQRDLTPDHALVSPAARTLQTWEALRENLDRAPPREAPGSLYLGEPGTLLACIGALPDTAVTALVVAHNPGLEVLARMLAGAAPDDAAMRAMMRGFPTAGLAVFAVNTNAWDRISVADTRLEQFVRPGDTDD